VFGGRGDARKYTGCKADSAVGVKVNRSKNETNSHVGRIYIWRSANIDVMTGAKFRIPPSDLERLAVFLKMETEDLKGLAKAVEAAEILDSVEGLIEDVKQKLNKSTSDIEQVISLVISLAHLSWRFHKSADDVIDLIKTRLESQEPEWYSAEKFEARVTLLKSMFRDSTSIKLLSKAQALFVEGSNILIEARVISDSRFVFGVEPDEIDASLILHQLTLDFLGSGYRPERISIQLDENDLNEIIYQCERALKKGEAISKTLSASGLKIMNPKE
jgi:hypothetical protein